MCIKRYVETYRFNSFIYNLWMICELFEHTSMNSVMDFYEIKNVSMLKNTLNKRIMI